MHTITVARVSPNQLTPAIELCVTAHWAQQRAAVRSKNKQGGIYYPWGAELQHPLQPVQLPDGEAAEEKQLHRHQEHVHRGQGGQKQFAGIQHSTCFSNNVLLPLLTGEPLLLLQFCPHLLPTPVSTEVCLTTQCQCPWWWWIWMPTRSTSW